MAVSLFFEAPGRVAVRAVEAPRPAPGELLVAAHLSAVSAGTEMLLYRGELPAALSLDETIAALSEQGSRYPLRYGYMNVGHVADIGSGVDPTWRGRLVFAFQPHDSHYAVPPDHVLPLPEGVLPEDAIFLPNMETAVSFCMDGRPVIGERVLVLGQGVVGLLTTALLAAMPLARLVVVDRYPRRRAMALELGADVALAPEEDIAAALGDADLVYELTGSPAALDLAIAHAGFGGRILVGSWYGSKRAAVDLGGRFHREHLRLISSQVSRLGPRWLARWTKARRLEVAWEMIRRLRPGRLISHRVPLAAAPGLYETLAHRPEEALQVVFEYD